MSSISLRRRVPRLAVLVGLTLFAIPLESAVPADAAPVSSSAASAGQYSESAVTPSTHPAAFNTKTQLLTAHPTTKNAVSCVSRTIVLASGFYSRHYLFNNTDINLSSGLVEIPAGTYEWSDCLKPENGFYSLSSSIFNHDLSEVFDLQAVNLQLTEDTSVTWGSALDPLF